MVIVCKRKGYSYELKEIIELQSYKMSDDPMNNRDMKKVRTPPTPATHLNFAKGPPSEVVPFAAGSFLELGLAANAGDESPQRLPFG